MIKLKNLEVVYPDKTKALDQINLEIGNREKVALIGANGAGKTSFILSLVGVVPTQGEIYIDNLLLKKENLKEIRKKVGIVFQNPDDQLFMPNIYEDLAFGLRNYGLKENEILERINFCLKDLGIEHLKNNSSLKLSGGQKRMVSIATVLVMEPAIIVFDEPTAFLDPKARRNLIKLLNSFSHTKIIATHDLDFAKAVCRRAILLKKGKVFADGLAKEILNDFSLMQECGM